MKKPIIANSVSENKKMEIFRMDTAKGEERLINEYVRAFTDENHLQGFILPAHARKIVTATAIYAVVLFLNVAWHCFYGEALTYNFLIFIGSTIALLAFSFKNKTGFNLEEQLKAEVRQRPSTPMDDVLISQVSGAVSGAKVKRIRIGLVLGAVLALCLLFGKPHMIFEKNGTGGYSLRYYTDSLIKENHVVIPDTWEGLPVNEIRGAVFYGHGEIISVELPDGLTEIRADTFYNCRKLRSICIPDGVTRIGAHAFRKCKALSEVYVPDSVSEIGSSAFRECYSLREIVLPRSCYYKDNAFKGSDTMVLRR